VVQQRERLIAAAEGWDVRWHSGSYNRLALQQAAGRALALTLFEEATRNVLLDRATQPVAIADYGSSRGRN
jgi:hypothetical protein